MNESNDFRDYRQMANSLKPEVYTIRESIMGGGLGIYESLRFLPKLTMFSNVFDEKLNFNKEGVRLNEFHKTCGLTVGIVSAIMHAYLYNTYTDYGKERLKYWGLELTKAAWMVYHGIDPMSCDTADQFIWFSCIGSSVTHKTKTVNCCVICQSRKNVFRCGEWLVTVSPSLLSGGRHPLFHPLFSDSKSFHVGSPTDFHFIIWSKNHDMDVDVPLGACHINNYTKRIFRVIGLDTGMYMFKRSGIFIHGDMQYGHDHVHFIGGVFFDLRAEEILAMVIRPCTLR